MNKPLQLPSLLSLEDLRILESFLITNVKHEELSRIYDTVFSKLSNHELGNVLEFAQSEGLTKLMNVINLLMSKD